MPVRRQALRSPGDEYVLSSCRPVALSSLLRVCKITIFLTHFMVRYNRCLHVITCYAIQYTGISFSCKKAGAVLLLSGFLPLYKFYGSLCQTKADLHTVNAASRHENIRSLYGQVPILYQNKTKSNMLTQLLCWACLVIMCKYTVALSSFVVPWIPYFSLSLG